MCLSLVLLEIAAEVHPSCTYLTTTTRGKKVRAFVPQPLLPTKPALAIESYEADARRIELALTRLSGVAGLLPSVD